MKKSSYLIALLLFFFAATNVEAQPIDSTTLNAANLTGTVNLNNNTIYIMKGFNYVKSGAVLNIEKGTLIYGDKETTGTLLIERGGKIMAEGTASQPIVFTSRIAPGQRAPGDWGGILILGRAPINTAAGLDSAQIEGFPPGTGPWYGGQPVIPDDNSGIMRYVRLEYPGVNLTGVSGNEINGLTMGGVGRGTILEYIQVSYCGDDAFEWFGGTVDAKYLIAIGTVDDDLDCDNGYSGKVQYALVVRDSLVADISASHFFEIDNNNNNPANFNSPRTSPTFSNVTCIGPMFNTSQTVNVDFRRGLHLRRNSLPKIYNSIFTGYPVGLRLDGSGVYNAAEGDTLQLRNGIWAGFTRLADTAGATSFSASQWLVQPQFQNRVLPQPSDVQLTNPFGWYGESGNNPSSNVNYWVPQVGSPALTGADFSNPNLAGFDVTTYVGAFGDNNNWILGWSNFNPQWYNPTPIGISQISEVVPDAFVLSQNFPNPFNPETKIQFSIPASEFVTLKVFDATGREITELVNQTLTVGTYEFSFNAARLTSGVYFYTLTAGDYRETKKMLLVK